MLNTVALLRQSKVQRRHLRLSRQAPVGLGQLDVQQHSWHQDAGEADTFTTMLTNLVRSRTLASTARAIGMPQQYPLY